MTLPILTPEQRAKNIAAAGAARKQRAELKKNLKDKNVTLDSVVAARSTDPIIGKTKVIHILESLPRIGKLRASEIMAELILADNKTMRGLGHNQANALLERFGYEPTAK